MPTPITEASDTQQMALAIIPKVASLLSVLGSSYIILDVVRLSFLSRSNSKAAVSCGNARKGNNNKASAYHRLLLGMSVSDLFASAAWFLSTWPIPADVLDVPFASGTKETCTAQGFFTQFSIATVLYNGFLSLYYYLVIKCGWSDQNISKHYFEVFAHTVSLGFAFGTSTTSVFLGLLNPIGWDCWISSVPLGCQQSWTLKLSTDPNAVVDCVQGDNSGLYQWLFFYVPLWLVIGMSSLAMFRVYRKYRLMNTKKDQNLTYNKPSVSNAGASTAPTSSAGFQVMNGWRLVLRGGCRSCRGDQRKTKLTAQQQRTNLVTTQALYYISAFYITWLFPTILRFMEVFSDTLYWDWIFLSAMFVPVQGILNFFVYLRPRIVSGRIKKHHRHKVQTNYLHTTTRATTKKDRSARQVGLLNDQQEKKQEENDDAEEVKDTDEIGSSDFSDVENSESVNRSSFMGNIKTFVNEVKEAMENGDDGVGDPLSEHAFNVVYSRDNNSTMAEDNFSVDGYGDGVEAGHHPKSRQFSYASQQDSERKAAVLRTMEAVTVEA